jgi:serine/threonine protein kinase
VHYFGREGDFQALVMERLGPSLDDLFNYCGKRFTIKTVSMIAIQLLTRMETLHSHQFVHRDVKPENFLIGSGKNQSTVYMIDMGLSKRYVNIKNGKHNPVKCDPRRLIGTVRYLSNNTVQGYEHSRRDDLESIGIMCIYFLKGNLPW